MPSKSRFYSELGMKKTKLDVNVSEEIIREKMCRERRAMMVILLDIQLYICVNGSYCISVHQTAEI